MIKKRAQLTIFVLLGVVIVVSLIAIYFFVISPNLETSPTEDPQKYIEGCIKDSVADAISLILPQGGYAEPTNFFNVGRDKIQYLCYTELDRKICAIDEPQLREHIQNEIRDYSLSAIEKCFATLRKEFASADYSEGETKYDVTISAEKIVAKVTKRINVVWEGSSQYFENFAYEDYSPIFEMILISSEILREETDCNCGREHCTVDLINIKKLNQEYELGFYASGDGKREYSITDLKTKQNFNFAVRNCVMTI